MFISSWTAAIANFFVPRKVFKVALFPSFLSCYLNHTLWTRVESAILFKASPVASFSEGPRRSPTLPTPGSFVSSAPEWHFFKATQDLRWYRATSRVRVPCCIVCRPPASSIICNSPSQDMTARLECPTPLRDLLLYGQIKNFRSSLSCLDSGFAVVSFSSTFYCSLPESYSFFKEFKIPFNLNHFVVFEKAQ